VHTAGSIRVKAPRGGADCVMCCADGADNLIFTAWEVRARLHTDDIYWRGNILRRGLVFREEIFAVIPIPTLDVWTGLDWTGHIG
jgi:hypothetical protein